MGWGGGRQYPYSWRALGEFNCDNSIVHGETDKCEKVVVSRRLMSEKP